MKNQWVRMAALALAPSLGACASSGASAQATPATPATQPSSVTTASRQGLRHYAAAAAFMQGMIGHHAQAVVMAQWAPTHGASDQLALFARKIIRSQNDDIELMQAWLRERGERVPDASDPHGGIDMSMPGHMMLMPGMLTAEQMAELNRARGSEFDRLFLTYMIQHHRGALVMVAKLFDTPGAGQTPEIFGFATGVDADQRAEIGRMQAMLATITGSTSK